MKQTSGKLFVEGCNNQTEEHIELVSRAKRSLIHCKAIESKQHFKTVRIDRKTFLLVRKEKYLANKVYYDSLFVP